MAGLVVHDPEAVLNPDVMPGARTVAVQGVSARILYRTTNGFEHPIRIVGVQMFAPTLWIGRHFLRRIAHDRAQVLADEGAGEIPRSFGRVDDRRTYGEQVLQSLPYVAQFRLGRLALGYVGPSADQLQRVAGFVFDKPECVLNPNVMTIAVAEAIFDRATTPLDQGPHLVEDSRRILGMKIA